MNPDRTPKLDHSDLLYGSKSPAEKKCMGVDGHVAAMLGVTVRGLVVTIKLLTLDQVNA